MFAAALAPRWVDTWQIRQGIAFERCRAMLRQAYYGEILTRAGITTKTIEPIQHTLCQFDDIHRYRPTPDNRHDVRVALLSKT